ncbi:MAG: hypothetical protein ACREIQ_00950 [Nitrospiria bacterium]
MEIDDEALRKLSEHVAEQRRTNDIREAEVTVMRRRETNVRLVLERYADLGERVTGLVHSVEKLILTLLGQAERQEEIAEKTEQVYQANLLILGQLFRQNSKLAGLIRGPEANRLKRLLGRKRQRLQKLLEREAVSGLDSPAEVLIEIENLQDEILELEKKLAKPDAEN